MSNAAIPREAVPGDKLTGAEPVERQELSERLLGLIGAYEMGAALDAQDLHINTAPGLSASTNSRATEPVVA